MRRLTLLAAGLAFILASAACGQSGTLQSATEELGAADLRSIEFSGTGRWFQFGQAPAPDLPWPAFDLSAYTASINYDTPAARVQMTRKQVVEPNRVRPAPAEQRPDQYVSGTAAWNMAVPGGAPAGTAPAAQPQPAAVEERTMEIWVTPHGFLKAAAANNATSQPNEGGSEVTFTAGKNKYVGTINSENQVERVETWIDNPVLGDTPVEVTFSEYRDFGGVMFPARIVRTQGGHPALELNVTAVKTNPAVDIQAPEAVRGAAASPPRVDVQKLADGVYYMTGANAHSIAIDQKDHIVVVEAPTSEARSIAVIEKVKETIPNKPIKYVVNTHAHFDHASGLRTYVAEGATVVTHEMNKPYFEKAWANPRTINPDRMAQSGKTATFETLTDKHVLTDGARSVEVHAIQGSGHNDAWVMVYLPKEKILIQGDAYTPPAANAPPPATPNPFAVNLNENIQRLKLDVRQHAALHGPGVKTMADFRSFIGQANATN
jgi:glyoxylase-like metal-dependent hydrolase (beta-lactamase superfamily II)